MKNDAEHILGKAITGIIKEYKGTGYPYSQLFLIIDDHSIYDFYADEGCKATGGLDRNTSFREVYNYMSERTEIAIQAVAPLDSGKYIYEIHDR